MLYETDVQASVVPQQPLQQAALVAEVEGQGLPNQPARYGQAPEQAPPLSVVRNMVNRVSEADVALGAYIPQDSPLQYVLKGQEAPNLQQDARTQGHAFYQPESGLTQAQRADYQTWQQQLQAQQQQQQQPWQAQFGATSDRGASIPLEAMSDGEIRQERQTYGMPQQQYFSQEQLQQGQQQQPYARDGAAYAMPPQQSQQYFGQDPFVAARQASGSDGRTRQLYEQEIPKIYPAEQLPDVYVSTGASLQKQNPSSAPSLEQEGEVTSRGSEQRYEGRGEEAEAHDSRKRHPLHHGSAAHREGASLWQAAKVEPHTMHKARGHSNAKQTSIEHAKEAKSRKSTEHKHRHHDSDDRD